MRFSAINTSTNEPIRFDYSKLAFHSPPPSGPVRDPTTETLLADAIKWQWLPRIKCNDCPKKMYNAVRANTEAEFEKHLRNRGHRVLVEERVAREKEEEGNGRRR